VIQLLATGTRRRHLAPVAQRIAVVVAAVAVGMLVGIAPTLGAVALSASLLVAVVALKPDWLTLAAVVLLYSNAAVIAHRIHGLPKPVAQTAALLVAVALAHHLGVKRRPLVLPPATPWIVAFLLLHVVGLIGAEDPGIAMENVQDFVTSGLFLYVAFVNVIRDRQLLQRTVWALLIVGALLGGAALHQQVTTNVDNNYLGFAQVREKVSERVAAEDGQGNPMRAEGPIGEKNRFAQLIFALAPFGVLLFVEHPRRLARILAAVMTALIVIGGTLTVSRGGAVALALTLLVLTALRYVPLRHLAIIALGLLFLLSTSPRYQERLATIGNLSELVVEDGAKSEVDGSTMGRLGANAAAFRVFAANPVVGVGPGNFNVHYREEAIEAGFRVREGTRSSHNTVLQILAEYGLLGAIAFFGAAGVTLRELHRARRRCLGRDPVLVALTGGAFGALICYLGAAAFLSYSYVRFYWFLLALASVAAVIAAREPDVDDEQQADAGPDVDDALVVVGHLR
jgi:putative inorganic carbon (hco3(-)) transporter